MSILLDFWCTDELALRALASVPPPDLRNCAQVSRLFNRIAVQSVLDQHKIWNAQQSASLQLADNPNDLDGLSALLLSIHVKSLSDVTFSLERVTSLQSALKTFHKMKRLVDRMASVRTVDVRWPSEAYAKQPISDKTLASACKCVEDFLETIIVKGCTTLQFGGFNAFASEYKLKKNPTSEIRRTPPAERPSVWESARGYLPSLHNRASSDTPSPLSEQGNYCRKSGRFSISAPSWITLTPSQSLDQVTKLASFYAYSTNLFRPPFSQWTFALLKASLVTDMTLSFRDAPNNDVEPKLILDRLAEAVPNLTTIHLVHGAKTSLMKDVIVWLGHFQQLGCLRIESDFFSPGTNFDDLELQPLARLPHIRELVSSSSFLCAYLASRRSIDNGLFARNLQTVIMRHLWTSSTRSAISAFMKDVERLHKAIIETCPRSEAQSIRLRISFLFNCPFSNAAQALVQMWDRFDSSMILRLPIDVDAEKKAPLQDPPCFRPTEPRLWLSLELHTQATEDEIQRGVVDDEVIAFCRMFPTLWELMLCSPLPGLVSFYSGRYLRKPRLDKLRAVCPDLNSARVY